MHIPTPNESFDSYVASVFWNRSIIVSNTKWTWRKEIPDYNQNYLAKIQDVVCYTSLQDGELLSSNTSNERWTNIILTLPWFLKIILIVGLFLCYSQL